MLGNNNAKPATLMSRQVARELNFAELSSVSGGEYEAQMATTKFTDCHASYTLDCASTDGGD